MSSAVRGRSQICVISDATGYPAWQPGIDLSITQTVDASPMLLTLDRLHAGIPGSITWSGKQFLTPQPAENGRNAGFSDTVLLSGESVDYNLYTPTWGGCQNDSSNKTSTCASNNLLRGKNAAGDGFSTLVQAANWLKNGQEDGSFPGHGGGRNKRDLTEMLSYVEFQIGLAGNGHIIQANRSILIPTDADIQVAANITLIPNYYYAPNPTVPDFLVMEFVDFTTGVATVYPGAPTASTTQVVMSSTATGTFAIAVVFGPGAASPVSYQGFAGGGASGFTSGQMRHIVAPDAGVWFEPTAICIGTRADLIGGSGAIVTAAAGLPTCTFTAGKTTLP